MGREEGSSMKDGRMEGWIERRACEGGHEAYRGRGERLHLHFVEAHCWSQPALLPLLLLSLEPFFLLLPSHSFFTTETPSLSYSPLILLLLSIVLVQSTFLVNIWFLIICGQCH